MNDGQSMVYLDYVNKELFYYRKRNTSINIVSFLDYDGVLLKNIFFAEGNVSALTVFGDSIYLQKMGTLIQEMNVSTGVAYRNISLPKPFSRLNDLAIVDQSQYPTGTMKQHACHSRTQCPSYARSTECDEGLWPNPYQTGI